MRFVLINRPEEEQKTFENLLGLTRQLSMPKIKTDFVIDYTTYNNNDIMAYEGGSYITRYTYGANEEKISQTASHHVGLTDVLKGKNPLSQIAVDDIKTAYIHSNHQGGTSYVTDKDGQVLSFAEYDPWGEILNEKPKSLNSAGLDDITDYTGHTYDDVLDKYFAKARFYDPLNKRFISEDPVKDGKNWYGYVDNNPVNFTDISGLYLVSFKIYVRSHHENRGDIVEYAGGAIGNRTIIIAPKGDYSKYYSIKENIDFKIDESGKAYYFMPPKNDISVDITDNPSHQVDNSDDIETDSYDFSEDSIDIYSDSDEEDYSEFENANTICTLVSTVPTVVTATDELDLEPVSEHGGMAFSRDLPYSYFY